MPKSYSEQEREYIRNRLKEEAAKCLASYGVRRTTVDEIVRRVNIPKGTFYLFYPSKELLLFEDLLLLLLEALLLLEELLVLFVEFPVVLPVLFWLRLLPDLLLWFELLVVSLEVLLLE